MKKKLIYILIVSMLGGMQASQAADSPGAAEVIKTNPPPTSPINKLDNADEVSEPVVDTDAGSANVPADSNVTDTIKVNVTGFKFSGNTVFDNNTLAAELGGDIGQERDSAGLQNLTKKIRRLYLKKGYFLSYVYLPKQEVEGGVVEIAILEGRVGQINVTVAPDVRFSEEKARSIILSHIKSGDLITDRTLEKPLLLIRDMAGLNAKSTINPSQEVGYADLNVEVTASKNRMFDGEFDFDNYGNRFAGEYRTGLSFNINSPLKMGDKLTLRGQFATNETDTNLAGLNYILPVGPYGTRVGASYSKINYKLGKNELFESLNLNGEAVIAQLTLQHPFIRSRGANIFVNVNYSWKETKDFSSDAGVTDERKRTFNNGVFSLSGDFQDKYEGYSFGDVSYTIGDSSLDPNAAIDDQNQFTGERTQGVFSKVNWFAARLQQLPSDFYVYFSMSGQQATKNLAFLEKYQLGGPFGVRAYPPGDAQGDNGQLYTLELRKPIPRLKIAGSDLVASAFYDIGMVDKFEEPTLNSIQNNTNNTLNRKGFGFGLNLNTSGYQLGATIAWPKSGTPATEQVDTSIRDPRVYINFAKLF